MIPSLSTTTIYYERDCESFAAYLRRPTFARTFVIVMDKPLLDSSPQEGNTESYSTSLRASSTLEISVGNIFVNFQLLRKLRKFSATKITKIFSYENLVLYGIIKGPSDKANHTCENML